MQTAFVVLGILLAGQISSPERDRYSQAPANSPPRYEAVDPVMPNQQQLWEEQAELKHEETSAQRQTTAPPATSPPASRLTKVIRPTELLASLTKPTNTELGGYPLSLGEAVLSADSRTEQTHRVNLYWTLSRAIAEYHLVSREQLELRALRNGLISATDHWNRAEQSVAARQDVALAAIRVMQLRLQKSLIGHSSSELPLPNDLPHCGAYETKYEQIFQGRTSLEAEQLAKLLPMRQQQLEQRAADAAAAREWYISVSQQRGGQEDSTQLLKAYEQVAMQRRAFVAAAYEYNADIARYTALAVPQNVAAKRLVAMLIQSRGNFQGDWQPGSVQQATVEQEISAGNAGNNPQRTFVGGGRSEARRLPVQERQGERSILVSPKQTAP